MIWESQAASMIFYLWYTMSNIVIIVAIFIFCYWRILAVIRQAKVIAHHSAAAVSSHVQHRVETNVHKTTIVASIFCAFSTLPGTVTFLLMMLPVHLTVFQSFFHANQLLPLLHMCTNLFVYATKFDPVKKSYSV